MPTYLSAGVMRWLMSTGHAGILVQKPLQLLAQISEPTYDGTIRNKRGPLLTSVWTL